MPLNFQGYESVCRIDPAHKHRGGIEAVKACFLSRTVSNGCCRLWTGTHGAGDYGHTSLNGRHTTAHRVAYILFVGEIQPGFEIDHLCLNWPCSCGGSRLCTLEEHLEQVTHVENLHRSPRYQSNRRYCPHGHERTPSNSYRQIYQGRLKLSCQVCRDIRNASKSLSRRPAHA